MVGVKALSALDLELGIARALEAAGLGRVSVEIRDVKFQRQDRSGRLGGAVVRASVSTLEEQEAWSDDPAQRYAELERCLGEEMSARVWGQAQVSVQSFDRQRHGSAAVVVNLQVKAGGNPFARLIKTGCEQQWCWKIGCTTCGAGVLRASISALARDPVRYDPDISPDQALAFHHLLDREAENLQRSIASLDLRWVMAEARFPDWLGILGMGLSMCESIERSDRIITKNLAPQFAVLIHPSDSVTRSWLESMVHSDEVLHWYSLERIERALIARRSGFI